MTKAFSKEEKDSIREMFLKKSILIFEKYGLKRTRIDDLTNAVGVAKGSFYSFFDSKEELFMEVLENIENNLKGKVFSQTKESYQKNEDFLERILMDAFLTWDSYPLLKNIQTSDYEYLARKLPPGRILQHQKRDKDFMENFLEKLKKEGIKTKTPLKTISNLLYSLFFISTHRNDFDADDYDETMKILIGLVAGRIIKGE